jgi:hypothetical protein
MTTVTGLPTEDAVYGVFQDFLGRHKLPPNRFTMAPQLAFKWKPKDKSDERKEVVDICVINLTYPGTSPRLRLRLGVEIKRALDIMETMPPPESIISDPEVQKAFKFATAQARDQAKTAFINNFTFSNTQAVDWIVAIGPYWVHLRFGPFTDAQLTVRALKPSDSGEWFKTFHEENILSAAAPPLRHLFLLGGEVSRTLSENHCFDRHGGPNPHRCTRIRVVTPIDQFVTSTSHS